MWLFWRVPHLSSIDWIIYFIQSKNTPPHILLSSAWNHYITSMETISKDENNLRNTYQTQSDILARIRRTKVVPHCGPAISSSTAPVAATCNTQGTCWNFPCRTICGCVVVIAMPPVLTPLPQASVHIVKSIIIRRFFGNRICNITTVRRVSTPMHVLIEKRAIFASVEVCNGEIVSARERCISVRVRL